MAVPYFRLKLTEDEIASVVSVLESGWLTTGKEAIAFEKEFAVFLGGGVEAVAVNSNTAGMHLMLEAIGIKPGDEVIVPALTFTATAEVVRYLGADPIFVDVDPITLCIDPSLVERAISPRTKAIIPVHFGGLTADMDRLIDIAHKHHLKIIEDAAHSFPATSGGSFIGRLGTAAAVFSFYANKTITTGEGGMIVTQNKELAKRCKVMRLHGIDKDAFERFTGRSAQWEYDVVAPGYKYNLTDIGAAIGRGQLRRAEALRLRRQRIADMYHEAFCDLPIMLPAQSGPDTHAWHIFPIRLLAQAPLTRDELMGKLSARDIGYSMHYTPLHRMSYWRERYALKDELFPVSSNHGDTSLSLPIFSDMTDIEVREVISNLLDIFGRLA